MFGFCCVFLWWLSGNVHGLILVVLLVFISFGVCVVLLVRSTFLCLGCFLSYGLLYVVWVVACWCGFLCVCVCVCGVGCFVRRWLFTLWVLFICFIVMSCVVVLVVFDG